MNTLGKLHVVPVLAPSDSTTTVTEVMTTAVNAGKYIELEFLLSMGVITGDTLVVKAYKDVNTTTSSGGTAIAFLYKLSDAAGTDSVGAWTLSASTGLTVTAGDDNKVLRVNIDPQLCGGYPYVYLGIDPGASMTNFVRGAVAIGVPRDAQSQPLTTLT
jgi:hypothetical protein